MRRALVTGATGFVGSHTCKALLAAGYAVTAATRRTKAPEIHPDAKVVNVGEIGPHTDWQQALDGVDVVIHAAARTHTLRERIASPENSYQTINTLATRALAIQAVECGVRRLIFISSVKAGGEFSNPGQPLLADFLPAPEDAYGRTKLEAEEILIDLACAGRMDVLILRVPLIYGPRVKGNMLTLFKAVNKGMILPLKCTNNKRDLIYVHNLVDAIMRIIELQKFDQKLYYLCDGDSISTADLVRQISCALDKPARLICLPTPILKILGWIIGQSNAVRKLTQTLEVNGAKFCEDAEWRAPFSRKEGLASTAAWFKSQSIK